MYVGPAELKFGAILLAGAVDGATRIAFKDLIGKLVTAFTERFGEAAEKTASTGAKQLEFTAGKDGTKVVVRGPETHPLPGSGGKPVTHVNVEIHEPAGQPGRFKKVEDVHLDADGRVINP